MTPNAMESRYGSPDGPGKSHENFCTYTYTLFPAATPDLCLSDTVDGVKRGGSPAREGNIQVTCGNRDSEPYTAGSSVLSCSCVQVLNGLPRKDQSY
jgi:hypothetical protein